MEIEKEHDQVSLMKWEEKTCEIECSEGKLEILWHEDFVSINEDSTTLFDKIF